MLNEALFSSARESWNTPTCILDLVRQFDVIELDPCGAADSLVNAKHEYRIDRGQNGLELPWSSDGINFVNPPYSRTLHYWVRKAFTEWMLHNVESILLVPSRTDAKWFQCAVDGANGVCFWAGRLKFEGAPSSAPFPSALFYHGHRVERFLAIFSQAGWVVSL